MKKLTLDVDTIAVESFPTAEIDAAARGTVDAHEDVAAFRTNRADSCYTSCRADLRDACTCPIP
jgi:hypothetical protein